MSEEIEILQIANGRNGQKLEKKIITRNQIIN